MWKASGQGGLWAEQPSDDMKAPGHGPVKDVLPALDKNGMSPGDGHMMHNTRMPRASIRIVHVDNVLCAVFISGALIAVS